MKPAPLKENPKGIKSLKDLTLELINSEFSLIALKTELQELEFMYIQAVGIQYSELNKVEAQIFETLSKKNPQNKFYKNQAALRRNLLKEAIYNYESFGTMGLSSISRHGNRIKNIFKKLIPVIHPVLALKPKEKLLKERLFERIRTFYLHKNEESLQRIYQRYSEYQRIIEKVIPPFTQADLAQVQKQSQERLIQIDKETDKLKKSDFYQIKCKTRNLDQDMENIFFEINRKAEREVLRYYI